MTVIRRLLAALAPAFAVAAIMIAAIAVSSDVPSSSPLEDLSWAPAAADAPVPEDMRPLARSDLTGADRAGWLRARFDFDQEVSPLSPPALELAGPFSARVYLNGELVGVKGEPALAPAAERAAPIDAVFALPNVAPTDNSLTIFYSAHHAWPRTWTLLQDFRILPTVRESQRSFSFYTIAALSFGLLATGCVVLGAGLARGAAPGARWAFVCCVLLVIALIAEVSRAWINYPYGLHAARMAILSSATVLAGYALARAVDQKFGRTTWPRAHLLGLVLLAPVFLLISNPDLATLIGLGLCGLNIAFCLSAPIRKRDWTAIAIAGVIVTVILFAAIDPWGWLNNSAFVTLAAPLIYFLPGGATEARGAASASPARVLIRSGGRTVSLPPADLVMVRSAGNYAELILRDGRTITLRGQLADICRQLAEPFMRVHRSHAVNMQLAQSLRRRSTGQYELTLDPAVQAIVSRKYLGAVRRRLGADQPDPIDAP